MVYCMVMSNVNCKSDVAMKQMLIDGRIATRVRGNYSSPSQGLAVNICLPYVQVIG